MPKMLPGSVKKKPVNFRLAPDVLDKLKQLAEWQANTAPRIIERLIRDEFAREEARRDMSDA